MLKTFFRKRWYGDNSAQALQKLDYLFADQPAWPSVRADIDKVVSEQPNKYIEQVQEGLVPSAVWLLLVVARTECDLKSGVDHLCRGRLSTIGESKAAIHFRAIKELVRIGYSEEDGWANKRSDNLLKEIQSAGRDRL